MKKLYWILAAFLAAALLLLVVHEKRKDTRVEEDGGTRNYVDTNAPKEILSTEIIAFRCKFSTVDRLREDTPIAGHIITLHADADGGYYELRNQSDTESEGSFTPDGEFFRQLQQIVTAYDFAQYNGQYYTVGGLPPNFGMELEIRYASGESICSSNNQSCFMPLEAMEALVALFQQK